jgi:hypothetical protein
MLQIRSSVKPGGHRVRLKAVAHRHNANVTVVSHLGQPHHVERPAAPGRRWSSPSIIPSCIRPC